MALVTPLLLLLLFGIIEVGWMFAQQVEIRNATREGARLAVVDYGDATEIINETCSRADLSGHVATITIALNGPTDADFDPPSPSSVTVTMTKTYESLTGFLDPLLGTVTMTSSAEMRTERPLVSLTSGGTGTCS